MDHKKIQDNVHLYVEETKKFKDLTIEVRFLSQINDKNATTRSILALMMQDRSVKYDTKIKMNSALDNLFGASLLIRTLGYGSCAVVRCAIRAIDKKYVNEDILNAQFNFLSEIIFKPLFVASTFDEAKLTLYNELLRTQDEPRDYAIKLAQQYAGHDYPLAINIDGELNVLEKITLNDVIAEYHKMLIEDEITITIVGDIKLVDVLNHVDTYLPFTKRETKQDTYYLVKSEKEQIIEVNKDLEQTNLVMVYNTNIAINDPLYYSLRIATIALGQLPISLLFTEIREKRSLCYNISSSLISFDGVMMIYTGIDDKNLEQSKSLIIEQVASIINNPLADKLMKASKEMLINSINSITDNPNAILNFVYQNHLLKQNCSYDDMIELIKQVDNESVMKAFKQLKLNTILTLRKKDVSDEKNR